MKAWHSDLMTRWSEQWWTQIVTLFWTVQGLVMFFRIFFFFMFVTSDLTAYSDNSKISLPSLKSSMPQTAFDWMTRSVFLPSKNAQTDVISQKNFVKYVLYSEKGKLWMVCSGLTIQSYWSLLTIVGTVCSKRHTSLCFVENWNYSADNQHITFETN